MSDDIIDIQDVLERVQDDWDLFIELLDIFVEDYSQKQEQLAQAVEDKDFEMIKDLIHSIKGATGNISARAMHKTCAAIEQLAEQKDLQKTKESLTLLDQQFADLQRQIVKIKKDAPGS